MYIQIKSLSTGSIYNDWETFMYPYFCMYPYFWRFFIYIHIATILQWCHVHKTATSMHINSTSSTNILTMSHLLTITSSVENQERIGRMGSQKDRERIEKGQISFILILFVCYRLVILLRSILYLSFFGFQLRCHAADKVVRCAESLKANVWLTIS